MGGDGLVIRPFMPRVSFAFTAAVRSADTPPRIVQEFLDLLMQVLGSPQGHLVPGDHDPGFVGDCVVPAPATKESR
jgi:hypothetical protein